MSGLEAAIAAECDKRMVSKWLLIAEVVDDAGERSLEIMSDAELSTWDRLGLLQVAINRAHNRLRGMA